MKIKKIIKKRIISFIICCSIVIGFFAPVSRMDKVYAYSAQLEQALQWAIAIANDNSHGYSQSNRWGNPDYDCSSFVISALKASGFDVGSATYTQNMRTQLTPRGFTWIPWNQIGSAANLRRGDILLNDSSVTSKQHTEFYLGNNQNVGAHGNKGYPAAGDQTGKEISVSGYYNHPWTGVLRYKDDALFLTTPQLSLTAGTNSYECGQSIAFNWTWGGTEADGYDLFIAKHIEGTVQYDWANAKRSFFPGNAVTSGVVGSSLFEAGGYAAYMQACAPNDKRSGQSNFVYFVVNDSMPKKGKAQWKIWVSRSKMGDETEVVPLGKPCYLCYQIIDKDTQKNWDELYNSNYKVKETYTYSNGKTYSYTYTNDNNWIAITPVEMGEYKGTAEITGDFTGKLECNFIAKKFYYGDINADNDITVTDLAMVNQAANNTTKLNADQKKRADVNADGEVTKEDATLIQQYVLGTITEFPAESHVHSYSSKVTKNATCTSTGVRTYSCACGESYTVTIPKTSHTPVTDQAVAATCTQAGKTEGTHCAVCGMVLKAQTPVPKLEHIWDAGKVTKQPTATVEGTKTYTCSMCKKVKTEQIPALGIQEHTHSYTSKVTQPATCTSEGTRIYTCACGYSYTEKIEKKQHTVVLDKGQPATCTQAGKTEGSHCSICGTVIKARETVAATGHIHTEVRNARAATTSSCGYTGDIYCKDCGAKISAGKVIEKIQGETEGGQDDEKDKDDPYGDDEVENDDDDVLEVGDMLYDVTEKAEYEVIKITGDTIFVSYNTTLNKRQKVITVPNQIKTEDGITCTVTAVSERAFCNNKNVRQIILSNHITKIGARAFSGCKKLSSLTIKSKMITSKSLNARAFKGISSKTKIKVPKTKKNSYKKIFYSKGLLKRVKVCNI